MTYPKPYIYPFFPLLFFTYGLSTLLLYLKSVKRDFQKISLEQASLTIYSDYHVLLFFL
jgi:hypothetical protein